MLSRTAGELYVQNVIWRLYSDVEGFLLCDSFPQFASSFVSKLPY